MTDVVSVELTQLIAASPENGFDSGNVPPLDEGTTSGNLSLDFTDLWN